MAVPFGDPIHGQSANSRTKGIKSTDLGEFATNVDIATAGSYGLNAHIGPWAKKPPVPFLIAEECCFWNKARRPPGGRHHTPASRVQAAGVPGIQIQAAIRIEQAGDGRVFGGWLDGVNQVFTWTGCTRSGSS